uniref:Frizzled-4 n=1 Tax=Strongyloides stercoralis TaxID=6248 RepID=A0A0K0DXJ0_STRER
MIIKINSLYFSAFYIFIKEMILSTLIKNSIIIFKLFLIYILYLSTIVSASIFDQTNKNRCVPVTLPICKDIPYNYTFIPNPIFPHDPATLHLQTDHFKPLIRTQCNPHIKFFICSVFAPMCPESLPQAVTSCKSVCQEVKKDCIKIFTEFDIQWPESLDCDKFPEEPSLCMKPNPIQMENNYYNHHFKQKYGSNNKLETIFTNRLAPSCPSDLINLDPGDRNASCAFKCNTDIMFSKKQKNDADYWLFIISIINISITTFTVLTFFIDKKRFRFPERSIFYIAACYIFYCLPYLLKYIYSYEDVGCLFTNGGQSYLIESGVDNRLCTISFIFSYYFSTAGSLWWLTLTLTWYLSAGKKWVPEGIESFTNYLHLFTWGISSILTMAVLITNKIDASELTGICSVGNLNPFSLLAFVILPKLFILTGSGLVVLGFSSLCRERDSFRQRGTDTTKLDKLLIKMGLYSLLYIGPMLVTLACDFYHYLVLQEWYPATIACKMYGGADRGGCRRQIRPQYEIYILRIGMQMFIGISTSIWIISLKTISAWKNFIFCTKEDKFIKVQEPQKVLLHKAPSGALYHSLIPSGNPPPPPPPPTQATSSTIQYIPCGVNNSGMPTNWNKGKIL